MRCESIVMDELLNECSVLNSMIRKSKEYKTFVQTLNNIKANEQLYNDLQEFRRRYDDVIRYTEGNPYDEIFRLYYENDDLLHESVVNEYLRAESAFSRLIRSMVTEITDGLELEI